MAKRKSRHLRKEFQVILPLALIIAGVFMISKFSFTEEPVYTKQERPLEHTEKNILWRGEPQITTASMYILGDALVQIECIDQARQEDGSYLWDGEMDGIANPAANYDLAFYNQETILGGDHLGITVFPHFNCPQSFGDYMVSKGFNLVSTANNHSLDKGEEAIVNSDTFWKGHPEVVTSGLNVSEEQRHEIAVHEVNGITYAFTAWTYGMNGYETEPGHEYMVNCYRDHEQELMNWVREADQKADIVIVSMHWGVEYTADPDNEQLSLAQQLADAGADIIIGNHPHNIQPVQWLNNGKTLCYYAMGNAINSQDVLEDTSWEEVNTGMASSLVIEKTVQPNGTVEIAIKDVKIDLIFTAYEGTFENIHSVFYKDIEEGLFPDKDAFYQKMIDDVVHRYDSSFQIGL